MRNNAAIETFLYNLYGFRRIQKCLEDGKLDRISVQTAIQGTIIGTPRRENNRKQPLIAKIKQGRACEGYAISEDLNFAGCNLPKFNPLEYFLHNRSFFRGWSCESTHRFVRDRVMPLFTGGRYTQTTSQYHWVCILDAEDFHFHVKGNLPQNTKELFVNFNCHPNLVEDIIRIVALYYSIINRRSK